MGNVILLWHSLSLPYNYFGYEGRIWVRRDVSVGVSLNHSKQSAEAGLSAELYCGFNCVKCLAIALISFFLTYYKTNEQIAWRYDLLILLLSFYINSLIYSYNV